MGQMSLRSSVIFFLSYRPSCQKRLTMALVVIYQQKENARIKKPLVFICAPFDVRFNTMGMHPPPPIKKGLEEMRLEFPELKYKREQRIEDYQSKRFIGCLRYQVSWKVYGMVKGIHF